MSDTQRGGGEAARLPGVRIEPRLDWAGEAATFYRSRAEDSEAALQAANAARQDAERKLAEAERRGNERLMHAGLKAHAAAAGMIDPDVLKLLDLAGAGVTLDPAGEVLGAREAIEALKAAKPWAFKQTAADKGSSPSIAAPPGSPPATGKTAMEMTEAEWRAERARLTRF